MQGYKREHFVPPWSIKPIITVLIPVYNHSKFIRNSIESILKQAEKQKSHFDLRIKLLNDGSTEQIYPLIKDLIDDEKLAYRERVNGGLPTALNDLYTWEFMESYPSDYVTWHSADNIYLPDSLYKMTSFLSANPDLDFTFSNVQLINEQGDPFPNSNYRVTDQFPNNSSILNLNYPAELLCEFSDNFINACFLERRISSNLSAPYNPKCKGFEDYLHWIAMALLGEGEHIGNVDPLYQYRLHEESLTSQLKAEVLRSEQKKYFDLLKLQKHKFQEGLYHISNLKIENKESKSSLGSYPTEIKDLSFSYFYKFLKLSSKKHISGYGQECFINGCYEVPNILQRARERYLGLFGTDYEKKGRVVIFLPDDLSTIRENLLKFIIENPDLGIVLFSASQKSRENADSLFLQSSLAKNIRIVDTRELTSEEEYIPLLNTLGSVDAVISICCFYTDIHRIINSNSHLLNDFCLEACLSASSGRVLFAPSILPKLISGPLPHLVSWDYKNHLPANLPALKTDLTYAHYNSILRTFSYSKVLKKQIWALILGLN